MENKQLTPVQQLIDRFKHLKEVALVQNDKIYLTACIKEIETYLPKEQEAIEVAYDAEEHEYCGCNNCNYCLEINNKPKPTATEYFTNKYGQTNI